MTDTARPEAPRLDPATHTAHTATGVTVAPVLRDSLGYRIKNKLLGPPLDTEQLQHERLGKPTALAVFASDNLSSVAYGTEEILRQLVPYIGVAAFSLVLPITTALLVVLAFLILSYRETIKAYPSAGGAYVVTKDNFGQKPALVAGVSLLTDYVLTVAVSVAAGTAALASAVHVLAPYAVPISLLFIWIIAYGNLRGVKESGKVFAVPTYFFIATMLLLLGFGIARALGGHLPVESLHRRGLVKIGNHAGNGLFMGASLFVFLRAFASGGAAVTGVEAISNGVPAFREPAWKNARTTLVIMGSTLGAMFFGLSMLASKTHVAPYRSGTPTVISQIGKIVFGGGALGHTLYYCLQAGTMLILVLAANTSFADFPRLASFQASDNFLPRQLTKRGHRLVFSNGILALALASTVLVVVTNAKVDHLIPLYAVGVFTSFTLSQAGMARHHWRLREPHWRKGLAINGFGAFLSLVVDIIIAIAKFKPKGAILGAWLIIVLVPVTVALLLRLAHQYEGEMAELEKDAPAAAEAPILRRHVVLVFIDQLDVAAARAIQYARTLTPDELRAVHIAIDSQRAEDLERQWRQLGLSRVALQLEECSDRRITRVAREIVAAALGDGQTEVSVLLPRRHYQRVWHRLLHDRTADALLSAMTGFAHANVTFVPYQLGELTAPPPPPPTRAAGTGTPKAPPATAVPTGPRADGTMPIAGVRPRSHAFVRGQVRSKRVQPWAGVPSLEFTLADDTGEIGIVFLGRRDVAGIELGTRMEIEGTVGEHHGRPAILNPQYRLLANN